MFTLQEALEAIKDKPEFSVKDKGQYTVIDYNVNNKETFFGSTPRQTEILHNLRGTAFDNETGRICRLGFHKFFNYGENPDLDKELDFSDKHVITQKIDGSCLFPIQLYKGPQEYVWGTRAGQTDVSALVDKFLSQSIIGDDYNDFVSFLLDLDHTPIFEYCSPENRVVLSYPEPQLVLIGIRSMETGYYASYESMCDLAKSFSIPVVKSYSSVNPEEFSSFIKQISELHDDEGVVIKFESGKHDGHMIKQKSTDYVLKHKTLDGLKYEKDCILLHLEGKLDDMIPILSKDRAEHIQKFVLDFDECMKHFTIWLNSYYYQFSDIDSQKDFALAIKDFEYKNFLFSMRKGENVLDLVYSYAKKQCSGIKPCSDFLYNIGMIVKY